MDTLLQISQLVAAFLALLGLGTGAPQKPVPAPTPTPVVIASPTPAPEPPRAAVFVPAPTPPPVVNTCGVGGILARIRQCESGGNYAANTGNGYYGAYQYDRSTWNNYGGYATANLAPASVQDAKAGADYARRGGSPWPTCSRR